MNMTHEPEEGQVSQEKFERYLRNFPRYRRTSYMGGEIYNTAWAGKYKQLGMHFTETDHYYITNLVLPYGQR
jgi:hypothetical protein